MKHLIIISTLLVTTNVLGQIQEPGIPESFNFTLKSKETISELSYSLSSKDIKAINDTAYDVGVAEQVNIDFFSSAHKTISENNVEIYQLKIQVKNTLGIGLNFDKFYLPENGKLFVFNEDKTILLGAFTSKNNQSDNKFSIQPIKGELIILEYNQPISTKSVANININRIAKIYRPIFGTKNSAQLKSSSCYTDVHCVSGLKVERSVLKWLFYDENDESYYVCSCALINQDVPANDVKPYILTANHCGKNADLSTATFYFNYQNSDCGNNDANQYNYTMTGGSKRAKRWLYDMFLLELNKFPPPDYNVHLAGWDRDKKGNLPDDMLGIHHPHGDEKNVSLGTMKSNTNPYFWRVVFDRNDTPTHPGSSGSPLFEDINDRVIGWDSYSTSDCDNLDGITRYGKFRKAWTGPSSAKRLKNWLDPNDNDNNQIDGKDPCFTNLLVDSRTFYSAQQRYQPENKVTVQAGNKIETSGNVVIKNGSEYKFTAGQQIVLKPGFHAEAGSNFTATIEPCEQIAKKMAGNSSEPNSPTTSQTLEENNVYKVNTEKLDLRINGTEVNIFPNPTNGLTVIEYSLKTPDVVTVEIYLVSGTKINSLLTQTPHDSGIYQVDFDASELPKGIYACILKTSDSVFTKKIIIQ
ncbi:MAG: 3-coathanger stack domain-containing protein [Thermotogota bacterium]